MKAFLIVFLCIFAVALGSPKGPGEKGAIQKDGDASSEVKPKPPQGEGALPGSEDKELTGAEDTAEDTDEEEDDTEEDDDDSEEGYGDNSEAEDSDQDDEDVDDDNEDKSDESRSKSKSI